MTMNVATERPTLTLPGLGLSGARTRVDAGDARKGVRPEEAGANGRGPAVAVSTETGRGVGPLSAVMAGLDRASSVADVALAATDAISGLLQQLREVASAARSPGSVKGDAFAGLVERIGEQTRAAAFGGVNVLDGSIPSGTLRAGADSDGSGEIALTARDLRPGGPNVTVTADADPAKALPAVEASIVNVEDAGQGLREEAKRVEAHRAFVGVLSNALTERPVEDLDIDGARLAALSIRQAMGGQGLSVANAGPAAVLSLFR